MQLKHLSAVGDHQLEVYCHLGLGDILWQLPSRLNLVLSDQDAPESRIREHDNVDRNNVIRSVTTSPRACGGLKALQAACLS